MVHYNDKISIQNISIYLYKISIQNINYKIVSYCFAIGPCTDFWLPITLNAPIYLDAFLLALNVSAVIVVNVPFFCFFFQFWYCLRMLLYQVMLLPLLLPLKMQQVPLNLPNLKNILNTMVKSNQHNHQIKFKFKFNSTQFKLN